MKKTITVLAVANGSKARFYFNDGPGHGIDHSPAFDLDEPKPHGQDIMADRPGRTHDRLGPGRHALGYSSDPARVAEKRFVLRIIDQIKGIECETGFDRLVVAAPPRILGELRQLLPAPLGDKVYGELNRDLTQIPVADLPSHFDGVIVL